MYNNHHASFGKQVLRALGGILLSLGFGGFWIGLCIGSVFLSIVSGAILLFGVFESIKSFLRSTSYARPRRNKRTYRRY